MGNCDDGSLVLLEMRLQPLDGLGVQVVRRLIQKKDIRLTEKKTAKGHPSSFSSGEILHEGIGRRTLEGVHSPFELGVDLPTTKVLNLLCKDSLTFYETVHLIVIHRLAELRRDIIVFGECIHDLLDSLLHYFEDGLFRIHLRFLFQIPDGISRSPDHFTLVGFFDTGDDLEKG